eukprot:COSAG04_NODE_19303_length_419_cov_0.959375_1_plen_85_part_01
MEIGEGQEEIDGTHVVPDALDRPTAPAELGGRGHVDAGGEERVVWGQRHAPTLRQLAASPAMIHCSHACQSRSLPPLLAAAAGSG